MGMHDSRNSMKMRRREAQAKKKAKERAQRAAHAERAAKSAKGSTRRGPRKDKAAAAG